MVSVYILFSAQWAVVRTFKLILRGYQSLFEREKCLNNSSAYLFFDTRCNYHLASRHHSAPEKK